MLALAVAGLSVGDRVTGRERRKVRVLLRPPPLTTQARPGFSLDADLKIWVDTVDMVDAAKRGECQMSVAIIIFVAMVAVVVGGLYYAVKLKGSATMNNQ
jgi:hypothetical protein